MQNSLPEKSVGAATPTAPTVTRHLLTTTAISHVLDSIGKTIWAAYLNKVTLQIHIQKFEILEISS